LNRRFGLQPYDEIGHVVVWLTIVQIGNRKSESSVLHKGIDQRMFVNEIRRLLFLLLRVRHDIVQMAVQHFLGFFARPEIYFGSGARSARLFIERNFRRLSHRTVRVNMRFTWILAFAMLAIPTVQVELDLYSKNSTRRFFPQALWRDKSYP
jgi:hypothetical protein